MRGGAVDEPGVSSTEITRRFPAGNGDDGVQLWPPSVLTKRHSDVPTTTLSSTAEIPNALIRSGNSGGMFNATGETVSPPSSLRQPPPPLAVFQSSFVVTSTTPLRAGTYAMAWVKIVRSSLTCCQVMPPSGLLNRPPLSEAASISFGSNGLTATEFVRPPCSRLGWCSPMVQFGKNLP